MSVNPDTAESAFGAIPDELRRLNQWIGYRLVMRDGPAPKPTKVPYQLNSPHRKAATNNPSTWASFPVTVAIDRTLHQTPQHADRAAGFAGIGFVFTGTDFAGVDFDRVRDPQTGAIDEWARNIIRALNSYTEISQSGTGLHTIVRLREPLITASEGGRYRAGRIEMYDATSPRFFVMTGVVDGMAVKDVRQVDLATWQAKLATLDPKATSLSRESAHDGDQSREDFHLACRLAQQLHCDREKVAEEFLGQAVQRDKLNRKDYVRRTVEAAIRKVQQEKVSNWSANDWPEPEPLGGELPPVQSFDIELMPASLRPLVEDTAERMQVPLDYPAVAAVLVLAGATNRRARIQPKAADTSWIVVPNLWGGIVAPPGYLKSPLITAMRRPLAKIETLWRIQYQSELSEYGQQKEEADLRMAAWKENYKSAIKGGKDTPIRPDDSIAEPVERRLITSDATAEKLHEILSDNPAGILVIRDELSGWLATLDKPGREGERGFFLSAWNGDTSYTMDRIGRGSIYVEACCVSFLGGIQPARLRTYLTNALQDGPLNDGLFQRFQVLVYPDTPPGWRYVDRPPNEAATTQAEHLCLKLASLDAEDPLFFRFDDGAQELFKAWLSEVEGKVRSGVLHPALESHLAKYRSLMPSLALLFELADGGTETVSLQHAQQAAAWCEYLESHARRVYSMIISPERQAAAELGRHLREEGWKREEGRFTVREIYRNCWTGLDSPEKVRPALEILSDAGWIRPIETDDRPGRPSESYAINPRLPRRTK